MSARTTTHHPENPSLPIKTPKQLVTVLVLAFVVPVVLIILLAKVVVSMRAPDPAVLAPEVVAVRIKPVADVAIQAGGSAPAAGAKSGEAIYASACTACHQTGVANAPKFGDKAVWAPRIGLGMGALYTSSIKGKGAMPPKGGQTALADADVRAAVDYMVAAAK